MEAGNHTIVEVEANQNAYSRYLELKNRIRIVFNIAEGLPGPSRESQIPLLLEMLKIPYSHSGPLTHAISLDKTLTKKVLITDGIKTPKFQLLKNRNEKYDSHLQFPLLIKPNAEGSSLGIFNENMVFDKVKLFERINWLFHQFDEPVLIEEYIDGREFTVSVLGNDPPRVLPIVEQNFDIFPENMPHFASYEAKWLFEDTLPDPTTAYFCPAQISLGLKEKIEQMSLKIFHILDCKDVARIDYRIDNQENIYFLEINTLPGMIADPQIISYLPIAARSAGFSFDGMVNTILNKALKRYGIVSGKKYYDISKQFLPQSFLAITR